MLPDISSTESLLWTSQGGSLLSFKDNFQRSLSTLMLPLTHTRKHTYMFTHVHVHTHTHIYINAPYRGEGQGERLRHWMFRQVFPKMNEGLEPVGTRHTCPVPCPEVEFQVSDLRGPNPPPPPVPFPNLSARAQLAGDLQDVTRRDLPAPPRNTLEKRREGEGS